jgi:hypothetical protein
MTPGTPHECGEDERQENNGPRGSPQDQNRRLLRPDDLGRDEKQVDGARLTTEACVRGSEREFNPEHNDNKGSKTRPKKEVQRDDDDFHDNLLNIKGSAIFYYTTGLSISSMIFTQQKTTLY